ncbi:GCG_CRPN prefix-to-repeats domain-containing protein [Lichenibacterium dinghuense]|uniref:GCG_CRPN prefix-to-repeats domain-containing protein n=1 Tax=Lichenibacterium dinghuense TaxID=2895977 RepID=UPI001F3AA689|nr:hypothetical protein [Lichenibacterium sp. 6Y81]
MKLTGFVLAAAIGLGGVSGAEALPIAAMPAAAASTVLVRGGCGYGEHRGFYGGCRLNRGPRGFIRRLETGAPRGCPPGRTRIRDICRFVR